MFPTMHLTPIALVPIVLACPRRKVLQLRDKSYNPTQEQGLHIAIPSEKPRHRDHCRRIPPSRGSGSIRMLRRTGSELPVEGFLAS
jgi:hypothetical protein